MFRPISSVDENIIFVEGYTNMGFGLRNGLFRLETINFQNGIIVLVSKLY